MLQTPPPTEAVMELGHHQTTGTGKMDILSPVQHSGCVAVVPWRHLRPLFSRFAKRIAERESANLAQELIAAACVRQGIQPGQPTIHADHGSSMTSKPVALLMADLGVTKTHSRPHASPWRRGDMPNDNQFSEAQFTPALAGGARETLKYRPEYPECFECQPDARFWAAEFFQWYNYGHHHSAHALLTSADVHFGRAEAMLHQRQQVLQVAYQKKLERFVKGLPIRAQLPGAVWINPPASALTIDRCNGYCDQE